MYIPDLLLSYGSFILQQRQLWGLSRLPTPLQRMLAMLKCVQDFSNLTKLIPV